MTIKIGGTVIPSPDNFKVTILDLYDGDTTTRSADGTMHSTLVATKRQIEMSWGILPWSAISTLLVTVSAPFFSVNYPDPQIGTYTTKTFYVGDRPVPMAVDVNGQIKWKGVSITLTEQ